MKIQSNEISAYVLALVALLLNLAFAQPIKAQTASSTNTGSLNVPIALITPILLQNGKVLIVSGDDFNALGSMPEPELYDPATGTWTMVPISAITSRAYTFIPNSTLTLLTNGKVLFTGGSNPNNGTSIADTDLFDPATAAWTLTGPLNFARQSHTATLLPNGKVLVTGGWGNTSVNNGITSSTEIYDPANGAWTTNGNLLIGRYDHSATLLQNGKVLIAGGIDTNGNTTASVELYDPGSGTATAIVLHNVARLSNGAVQIGATNAVGASLTALAATNLALPATNWTVLGPLTEAPPGNFQFTDTQATNNSQRFYRLRSP